MIFCWTIITGSAYTIGEGASTIRGANVCPYVASLSADLGAAFSFCCPDKRCSFYSTVPSSFVFDFPDRAIAIYVDDRHIEFIFFPV